jgi:hypothetical protein
MGRRALFGCSLWIKQRHRNFARMPSDADSLCPGFRQVEEFGPEEEYEDEETFYVTLDLGNIEPTLVPTSTEYRLIVSYCR